jgi:hypothetical protein
MVNTGESTRSNVERQLVTHRAVVQLIGRVGRADQDVVEAGIDLRGLTGKPRP